jgi:proteasome lid subunit RPN8/RPN11
MISQLNLNKSQIDEMIYHIEVHVPLEACGLLAGKKDRVEKVLSVRNQAQSPVRFVMEPYEQLQAFQWIESQGLDLVGIFHSHPMGPEVASPTDIAEAAYEVVHLIWSRPNGTWKPRGFWIENGQVIEIPVLISSK